MTVRFSSTLLLIACIGAASAAHADVNERFFDAPWIGYDTAVYPEGINPWSSRTADFNSDGFPDLATVSWNGTGYLSILMNDGKGGYEPPVTHELLLESLDLAVADFDGDGDIDIVTSDTGRFWEGISVSLWENDGSGSFSFTAWFDMGNNGPSGITAADFDGDGDVDVATANDEYIECNNTVSVLFNNGNGLFQNATVYSIDSCTRDITSGDLDGDGDPDLVVGHESNRFTVLWNDEGDFEADPSRTGVSVGSIPELPTVHLSDFDLDGDLDIFFSNRDTGGVGSGGLGFFENNGDGTFGSGQLISFEVYTTGAVDIFTADVTGDGWPDALAATEATSNWFLIPGDGAGGFGTPRRLRAGQSPISMQAPDFDLDGDLDVVVVARDSLEACVYLNPGDGGFIQPDVIDMVSSSISPAFTTNLESIDVDNDGDLDLAVGYRSDFEESFGISVRRNNGEGTFAEAELYEEATYAQFVRLRDINGNGLPDIIWIDSNSRLNTRLNQGDGTFGPRNGSHTISSGDYLDLWDVDDDGDLDAVVGSFFSVAILMNNGNGTFATPIFHDIDGGTESIGMGDFDEDGNLDLLTPSGAQGYPQISFGNGDGTFGEPNTVPTGRDVHAFAVGHIDHDGDLDFGAVYNLDETGLSVRRGRGDGNFFLNENFHGSYDEADHTSSLKLADVDGDGNLDAMTATFGAQDFSFWKGNGDGTFQRVVRYGVAQRAYDIAFGDYDGDGLGDAAITTQTVHGSWSYPAVVILKGIDPSDSDAIEAPLTDLEIVKGSVLDGGVAELEHSDDATVHTRSEPGLFASEPNVMEMIIGAETDIDPAAVIDLSIESRINHPVGTATIAIRNWSTNQFEQVGQYDIGTSETVETFNDIDATDSVRDADGRIEVSVKHVVIATFTASGFDSFFDHVELTVE